MAFGCLAWHFGDMPLDLQHPVFSPPPRETVIWRYLTLAKALDLFLGRAIYFPSVLELRADDPLEGRSTNLTRRMLKQAASDVDLAKQMYDPTGTQEAASMLGLAKLMLDQLDLVSKVHVVSCWHESDHESAALWKLYSLQGEGIAIRTTFGRLCDALQSELPIFAGRVEYQDYSTTVTKQGNAFHTVITKRHSFEHEKEVRFVVADFKRLDAGADVSRGMLIAADPAQFVDEVVLSPYVPVWAAEAIQKTLKMLGCGAPINRSPLMSID